MGKLDFISNGKLEEKKEVVSLPSAPSIKRNHSISNITASMLQFNVTNGASDAEYADTNIFTVIVATINRNHPQADSLGSHIEEIDKVLLHFGIQCEEMEGVFQGERNFHGTFLTNEVIIAFIQQYGWTYNPRL